MEDVLKGIPARPQRQDALNRQLQDVILVASRLGMHDAVDAIKQAFKGGTFSDIKYGCHLEVWDTIDGQPDNCVLNSGDVEDCIYAKEGMRPEQCEYWRIVVPKE